MRTRKVCHEGLQNIISQCRLPVEDPKPFALTLGETIPTSLVTDSTLTAYPTPLSAVGGATSRPPVEAAILTGISMDEGQESSEQGPLDVDTTASADVNQPPAVVVKDLEPSVSAEPTIEHVEVVENLTPSSGAAVERTTVEPVASTLCENAIDQVEQARDQAELTRVETKGLAEQTGELAAKEEADRTAREVVEEARVEREVREAEKEKERQTELKFGEEREAERAKCDEAESVRLDTSDLQRQADLVEKQTFEEEVQKLPDAAIAKLEAEAARLEAECKEREEARLLAKEKEIEEASDCPVAPSTPRSELSSITSGFDSPSQVSLASHMATAPDSPRISPEDPTPVVELPESDLILQNRSPKSINSSIAAEPPETPMGSLPSNGLLAVGGSCLLASMRADDSL